MPTPPSTGQSEIDERPRHDDAGGLARLPTTGPVDIPLRTVRRRSRDGESFVVVANVPPRSSIVIRVSAASDMPPSARGLAGVTVAVRAVPFTSGGEDDENDGETRVFDRVSMPLLPSPALPVATVASACSPTEVLGKPDDPRAAQDTLRCAADRGPAQAGAHTSWFAMSAACLVASAVALFSLLPGAEDELPAARTTAAEAAPLPAVVVTPVVAPVLPVRAPTAPAPSVEPLLPTARLELRDLTLDVTASPWMEVRLDGKSLGNTPRTAVHLTPGTHEITLINRDLALETRTVVSAEEGSTETQEIAFE